MMDHEQNAELHRLGRALWDAEKAETAAVARAAKIQADAIARTEDARRAVRVKADECGLVGPVLLQVGRGLFVWVPGGLPVLGGMAGTDDTDALYDASLEPPDFPITLGPGEVCKVAGEYVAGTDAGAYINEADRIALKVGEIAQDGAIWHLEK